MANNEEQVYQERVKNLGQIAAIVFSTTEPKNKKILWYDETVTEGSPLKFYNLTTQLWELLVK